MTDININSYRKLKPEEIKKLEIQACSSDNWESINVSDGFHADNVRNVIFSGEIFLGANGTKFTNQDGIARNYGIYNSMISNCIIKDNVYINNIGQYISNYTIDQNVIIENSGLISTGKNSSFGNGHKINVLNEGGGREIKIFNNLYSQLAYLIINYRYKKKFIEIIDSLIDSFTKEIISDYGRISQNSVIQNCGSIKNVNIGKNAVLTGSSSLYNGTIISSKEDPCIIGNNVIARNFIISEGCKIEDGAIIHDCFIGQACHLAKNISAEQSLFFANSEAYHGEFLSVFAGPYTVSHHKSSLLIAGMYSFYNAGSGSNKSNHMYRLGPVHQGILERGCKTGSYSYLIWPSHIGAFSSVIGKHTGRIDSSDFPFSYISANEGKSKIIPGLNYFSAGTTRDGIKWPGRDRRKTKNKTDLINFSILSPYTIQKVVAGLYLLNTFIDNIPENQEYINHKGLHIKISQLDNYCINYEIILNKYIGEKLIEYLSSGNTEKLFKKKKTINISGKWLDIGGLVCPEMSINKLLEDIENGSIKDLGSIENKFRKINDKLPEYEQAWIIKLIENNLLIKQEEFSKDIFYNMITEWKKVYDHYTDLVLIDAKKEFNSASQIGYGLNSGESDKLDDFTAVRGTFENNIFVKQINSEYKRLITLADKVLADLEKD